MAAYYNTDGDEDAAAGDIDVAHAQPGGNGGA